MYKRQTENRRRHIEDEGAECTIEKVNYDDCVRMVAEEAKHAERGVVIQDTAWEGYEEIPSWIMQGYSTMADEAVEQFEERPTHVFVQAGVGSLAGGVVGYFANKYKTVSYTHLPREGLDDGVIKAMRELGIRGIFGRGCMDTGIQYGVHPGITPVSYTHLMPGGLGMAAIVASMFFAAISGSGPATRCV